MNYYPGLDDRNFEHLNNFYNEIIKSKMINDNIKVPGLLVKDE